jgi:pimeloyl-ACP methyl ester carboxylesterase
MFPDMEHDALFVDSVTGKPLKSTYLKNYAKKVINGSKYCEALNHLTNHSFRHRFITLNIAKSIKKISAQGSFSSILTLGTKFNWTVDTSLREAGFLEPDTILDKVPNYANYLNSLHPDRWEENMQYTRDLMLSLGRNPVLSDDLIGSITIPVTIARGTLDKMVSREESERITDLSRNGTYIELNDVKHPIHQIDPARVSEYILSCFSNVL